MAVKKPAVEQPVMEQSTGAVVKNLTMQTLAIGGVTIAPGGEAVIDNWGEIKSATVIMTWLEAGVIAV